VSEKSHGKRVKVPVDSIPKAHTWLPDGALACGVQNCFCRARYCGGAERGTAKGERDTVEGDLAQWLQAETRSRRAAC
jgi:hypothetical protein